MSIGTLAASVFRDHTTQGVPSSGNWKPSKAEIRALFAALDSVLATVGDELRVVQLAENSWGYDDPTNTSKWLSTPLRAGLESTFGFFNVSLRNDSVGGATIGVPSDPYNLRTLLPTLLAAGGVTVVIGRNPLNDISLGRSAAQILADTAYCKGLCDAAGALYLVPNCPPFNNPAGTNFYNSGTRATADAVNAGYAAAYGADDIVIDYWGAFNDPGNDGMMKSAYWLANDDRYHFNGSGASVATSLILAVPALADAMTSTDFDRATLKALLKKLDLGAVWQMRGFVAGKVSAPVGITNVYPTNPLLDTYAKFTAQPNDFASGWGEMATIAGSYNFNRFAAGTPTARLSLAPTGVTTTSLYSKMHILADTQTLLQTGTTFGGGAGYGLESEPAAPSGWVVKSFINGGANYGSLNVLANSLTTYGNGGNNARGLLSFGVSGSAMFLFDTGGYVMSGVTYLCTSVSNVASLGASALPFTTAYLQTAAVITSDRRLKDDIRAVAPDFAERILARVEPASFVMREAAALTERVEVGRRKILAPVEEEIEVEGTAIEVINGRATQVIRKEKRKATKVDRLPVFDADGKPVMVVARPAIGRPGDSDYQPEVLTQLVHEQPVLQEQEVIDYEERVVGSRAGKRRHLGFIAQDVRDAFAAEGEDPFDWAMIGLEDPEKPDSMLRLRTDHAVPLLWSVVRQQQKQIEERAAKIDGLPSKLAQRDARSAKG